MAPIHDNRNTNHNSDMNERRTRSIFPYILFGLSALTVIYGLFFMFGEPNRTVASNQPAAVTTTP